MTKEEFRKRMEEFWAWTSSRERPAHSWFLSLEQYARQGFNEEYDKHYGRKKEDGSNG